MARARGRFERDPDPLDNPWTRPLGGPSKRRRRDGWVSLARMLRSGMGVPESLRMLAGDQKDDLSGAFVRSAQAIERGASLAEALGQQKGLVNPEEAQMLAAAERVGDLAPVLEGMAEDLDAGIALNRELVRRATYPFFLLISTALVGPLPLIVTGGVGAYLGSVGKSLLIIVLLGPGLFFGARQLLSRPSPRRALQRFAWRTPWGAGAYRDRVRARYARVLGRNIESGLPIYESIESAAKCTSDTLFIEASKEVVQALSRGDELTAALASTPIFEPGDRMQLVSAERSGTLDDTFRRLAAHYDERSQRRLRRAAAIFSATLTCIAVVYVGMSIVGSYRDAVMGPLELLEKEMPHLKR